MSLSSMSSMASYISKKSGGGGGGGASSGLTQTAILSSITLMPQVDGGISIGISKNGQSIVYVNNSKGVSLSTNYGASFTTVTSTTLTAVSQVVVSNDGVNILLVQSYNSLMRSKDSGSNWTSCLLAAASAAMSSSGQYQVATVSGNIHVSTNYGVNWTLKVSGYGALICAVNSTGQYMVTSMNYGPNAKINYQYSTNYGETWTLKSNNVGNYFGRHISISDDGMSFVSNGLFDLGVTNSSISRNAGTSTTFSSTTVLSKTNNASYFTQAINGNGNDVYFLNTNKLLKSSDNLQTFSEVGTSTVVGSYPFIYASANCKYILSYSGTNLTNGALWLTTNSDITEI